VISAYGPKVAMYAKTDVTTANRLSLLIKLYDSAVRFMNAAKESMSSNKPSDKGYNIGKAMAIISEFKVTLDHKAAPELAANLERLYNFINSCLLEANAKNNPVKLDEALKVTNILREAWVELSQQMSNSTEMIDSAAQQFNESSGLRISV
jgi:flagellar secretion chaperone FliS